MKKPILLAAAAMLTVSLAACDQKAETLTAQAPDPQADALAKAPKVELPPSIKASVTFRCKDNSLVYVDFMSGNKIAEFRTAKDAPYIKLTADKAGDPLVADGYSMKGTPESITLTQPGKASQTCHL